MYQKGKIYSIRSHQTDKIYIGSTVQSLCKRIAQHRVNYRRYLNGTYSYVTSFKLLEYPDFFIELHETYPCDNKEELHRRESEIIREFGDNCINKYIPGRTQKEWYEDNREKIKEYRENHREQIEEIRKEKMTCECGSNVRKDHMIKHKKSLKHLNFINSKNIE